MRNSAPAGNAGAPRLMSEATLDIQADLAGIVGESRVASDPAVCANFVVDGVAPKCVVYPGSAEQVAQVLKRAADRDLAVIPCRNGTKLEIGAPPGRYDVALSLKDMNQIWYCEPDDLVVSVEPGMKFGDLQHFLGRHGLWIPLDPGGGERGSVGGILATNSAGPLRLHYGAPRDIVLGLKIATVEGKVIQTGGRVVKNVAGYDLAKLLVGSYGTLGVIVEASFKLYPQVAERATWTIEPKTLAGVAELRRNLLRSPLHPLRMVLLNGVARSLAGDEGASGGTRAASEVWIEAGGSPRVIERYARELDELGGTLGMSLRRVEPEGAAEMWPRLADFATWLTTERQAPAVLKASLPIAAGEEFLERAEKEAAHEGFEAPGLCQLGVGVVELGLIGRATPGSQYVASEPEASNPEARVPNPGLIARLRDAAESLGGKLVVERCPAELKEKIDVWGPGGDDFEVMRRLKAAWDPKGTLAPGRFVGGL
jgi:glycolate oxidase FAD binding subunit